MAPTETPKKGDTQAAAAYDLNLHVEARKGFPSRPIPGKGSDVWTWIKEKAAHDSKVGGSPTGQDNLWMVHGKWYDLNDYIYQHPGGADWLKLTKGHDITEAFEVHHLNMKKVNKILERFYVADAAKGYVGRYTWDENSFYPTLKRKVCKYFMELGPRANGMPNTHSTTGFKCLCVFAIVVHFTSFFWMLHGLSTWDREGSAVLQALKVIAAGVFCGFTLQTFHGIGHNALHMQDNIWMYAYDWCGWKHHKHRVSHDLSHHLFPNTQMDLEHPEPGSYVFTSNAEKNVRSVILWGPLYMWSGPLRDIFSLWQGLITGAEQWRFEYLFNMIQFVLCLYMSKSTENPAFGLCKGLLAFCTMHFTTGGVIEWAGFGLHRSAFCWSHGDPNAKIDFGDHALAATADHDVDVDLLQSLYFYQILNNHGVHHLFPTVCKSRMAEVMPIFKETCKEFNVPWQEYEHRDMVWSLWKVWLKGLYQNTPNISKAPQGHPVVPGSTLRINPLNGPVPKGHTSKLGAEISGVQIADVTEAEARAIKKAWEDYGVLVFRDQVLNPHQELDWAKRFPHNRTCEMMKFCGPLAQEGFDAAEWRNFKLKDRPEIQLRGYGQLNDYFGVTGLLDTGKAALEYHSDSLHEYDTPPIYTSLHCHKTPGKDETLFIDCRLAYDLLTEAEKARVETLFVQYRREPQPLHVSGLCADFNADSSTLGKLYGKAVDKYCESPKAGDDGDDMSPTKSIFDDVKVSEVHPFVWTHPSTGTKAVISASMWMYRIVEQDGTPWTQAESHEFLYNILKRVEPYKYAHVWAKGDLVCFDNRSLMHSANRVNVDAQGERLLHQIILCGDQIPQGPAGVGVGNPVVNPNVTGLR